MYAQSALALVDIVALFNWTYVSTIASEGSYGESGIEAFQQEANKRNICIAVQEKVPSWADQLKFEEIISNLLVKSARAVVLFTRADDARGLLSAAKSLGRENDFYWIASDGWGKQQQVIEGLEDAAAGAITVELESKLIPEFDEYMFNLNPEKNTRNPWFLHYWQIITGCVQKNEMTAENEEDGFSICTQFDSIRSSKHYEQDSKVQFVIDAVYAFAHALQNMKNDLCPDYNGACPAMRRMDGGQFYKDYLLKVSFTDIGNSTVKFDEKGDGLARYIIYNYQRKLGGAGFDYKVIGKWFKNLEMEASAVEWGSDISRLGGEFLPVSRCSEPCGPGAVKKMTEGETCCWVCNTCLDYEYMVDEYTCQDCGVGRWPIANKSACFDIEVEHMSWVSIFAIVPLCLSSIGILLTLGTILVLLKHKDTPIVRASGRELSYILLSGILLCYINTFFLISKPGQIICTLQRFGVGTGFSVVYGALLTKTNRIFRIFQSAAQSAIRPSLISPYSQVFITLCLVSVQFCATVVWCFIHHPGVLYDYPRRDQVILKCNINDSSFVISQVYNMLLISVCTVYAIKTRKVPENFNEAKFIGFTMYTTCVIWLAFVALYFGTGNSYEIQITTLCVSISLSGYVSLICLYSPKLYIILLHPEKNVRRLTMNTTTNNRNAGQGFPYQEKMNVHKKNSGEYNMLSAKPHQPISANCSLKKNICENENNHTKKMSTVTFCPRNGGGVVETAIVTVNSKPDIVEEVLESIQQENKSDEKSNLRLHKSKMEENIKSKMKENIKSKMEENIKSKMEENIKSFPSSEDMKTPTINNKIGISENPVYNEDARIETTIVPNLMNGSQSLNSTPGPGFQSLNSTPGPIRFKNLLLDQSRNHQ
ncbi:metabotropic glutamate receptor, partial [Eurytemora carolleeae]|uniref:metabotropic glutamate receptor n=1 Tax=Eurytemora carolleeae TaxID=1294199 RepID=UPI000C78834B